MSNMKDQVDSHVERWINDSVLKMSAYQVPDASGFVKLDAMENPFVWPEKMHAEWLDVLKVEHLNRYPHPDAPQVIAGIRSIYDVPEGCDILLGNGSDELIQLIAMAVSASGRPILAPEPSFVMYGMIAKFLGVDYVGVPLNEHFELDLERMLKAIEVEDPAVIFLAQPNNPTGNLWGNEKLRRILEASNGLVVIDEAYTAFTDANYLSWLDEYPNLLVMRTFSKVGLAGLRLGMLFGHEGWITQINKLRLPYNIGSLVQATASFALRHFEIFKSQTDELIRQRELLTKSLMDLPSITVFPSEANFILIRAAEGNGAKLHADLKTNGILVKKLDGAHPALKDCLRINVSSEEENQQLITTLKSLLD